MPFPVTVRTLFCLFLLTKTSSKRSLSLSFHQSSNSETITSERLIIPHQYKERVTRERELIVLTHGNLMRTSRARFGTFVGHHTTHCQSLTLFLVKTLPHAYSYTLLSHTLTWLLNNNKETKGKGKVFNSKTHTIFNSVSALLFPTLSFLALSFFSLPASAFPCQSSRLF